MATPSYVGGAPPQTLFSGALTQDAEALTSYANVTNAASSQIFFSVDAIGSVTQLEIKIYGKTAAAADVLIRVARINVLGETAPVRRILDLLPVGDQVRIGIAVTGGTFTGCSVTAVLLSDVNASRGIQPSGALVYSYGTAAVSAQVTAVAIGAAGLADARAFSEAFELDHVEIQLDTIAGGATAVASTFRLAWDSGGDSALSSRPLVGATPTAASIITGNTTATDGSVILSYGGEIRRNDFGSPGQIYALVQLDAGTANAKIYVYWRAREWDLV